MIYILRCSLVLSWYLRVYAGDDGGLVLLRYYFFCVLWCCWWFFYGALDTVPVAGIVIILGVDRFMSEGRSITNMIGNAISTIIISKWHGQLNEDKLRSMLKY